MPSLYLYFVFASASLLFTLYIFFTSLEWDTPFSSSPSTLNLNTITTQSTSSSRNFKLQNVFHRPLLPSSSSSSFIDLHSLDPNLTSSAPVYSLSGSSLSLLSWDPSFSKSHAKTSSSFNFPHFPIRAHPLTTSSLYPMSTSSNPHTMDYLVPDIFDKPTVLSLAHMAASSYILPNTPDWVPIDGYKSNVSFGWNDDGLRGYVYTTEEEDLVIVSIKGTTASFLGIGGETAPNDKINDNHMFSCCCAHVDFTWKPICNCFSPGHRCNKTCLRKHSNYESSYYQASLDLYHAIWKAYPKSMIWFTGHSLGGALSALLALTYTRPAITFQAPGEKQFASLLGLPLQNQLPLYHLGHDVDPIFLGHCNGMSSPCYHAGYAIETRCHVGHTCIYPAKQAGLKEDIRHHRIFEVIEILQELDTYPVCQIDKACMDCSQWQYF